MGRYSMNLRPIYGPTETTRGERLNAGIGNALDQYLKYQEAGRTERNTMAMNGATPQPADPADSPMGRLRGIGSRLRGLFGGGDEPTALPASATSAITAPAQLQQNGQRLGPIPSTVPPIDPGFTSSRAPSPVADAGFTARPASPFAPARPTIGAALADGNDREPDHDPDDGEQQFSYNPATPAAPAPAAPAPVAAPARPSIAAALAPHTVTYEGVHGDRYNVDPQYAEHAKQAATDASDEEKIAAAVAAGMPPAEARARVKNNLMRYDETFGQRPRTGLSLAEQEELVRVKGEQTRLTQKERSPSGLTPAERDRLYGLKARELDLREQGMQERSARADVTGDVAIANTVGHTIPNDPITRATQTESEKAQTTRREGQRDVAINSAISGQQKIKNGRTDEATRTRASARAKALHSAGKSAAEITAILTSEGYKVH